VFYLLSIVLKLSPEQSLGLQTTLALWLVADFKVLAYQTSPNFNKSKNLETCTATAISRVGRAGYPAFPL
jgi:hypothetical protein